MDSELRRRHFLGIASAFGLGLAFPFLRTQSLADDFMEVASAPICGLVSDSRFKLHLTGPGQPESPDRFDAVHAALESSGLTSRLKRIAGREATREEILRVHTPEYHDIETRNTFPGKYGAFILIVAGSGRYAQGAGLILPIWKKAPAA